MSQWPDDLPARRIMEGFREIAQANREELRDQATEISHDAVADHERRMHSGPEDDLDVSATPDEPLSDEAICSVIEQANREQVSYAYVCELRGIAYYRFELDFADYRRRYRNAVRRAGMAR